jgi:hypothetical protein
MPENRRRTRSTRLAEWKLSRLSLRAEKELEYRFRSPSEGLGGGVSSSIVAAYIAGVKLSLSELGLTTPEDERVDPGLGDDGISCCDGEEERLGALNGCMNVTLGRRGNGALASFSRDREV